MALVKFNKKIYLDVCCYNRPFDDLSDDRIRLESEAVAIILERCEQDFYYLVSSEIVSHEISRIPNKDKLNAVLRLSNTSKVIVKVNEKIIKRVKQFQESSIKPFDALHLALAEHEKVNIFLTTDYKLIKKAKTLEVQCRVMNPIDFIHKEIFNE